MRPHRRQTPLWRLHRNRSVFAICRRLSRTSTNTRISTRHLFAVIDCHVEKSWLAALFHHHCAWALQWDGSACHRHPARLNKDCARIHQGTKDHCPICLGWTSHDGASSWDPGSKPPPLGPAQSVPRSQHNVMLSHCRCTSSMTFDKFRDH